MQLKSIAHRALAAGALFGGAVMASAAAGADAIDDAWPYLTAPNGRLTSLPGYQGPQTFYPDTTAEDVTYLHHPDLTVGVDKADEWYTAHQTVSNFLFGSEVHQVVTAVLDGSTYPHVGTVADGLNLFVLPVYPVGFPLIQNSYLDDPQLGFADWLNVIGISNFYLSDAAGVKDSLSLFGLPAFTLFEIPAADPAGVSDLGAGFHELLSELSASALS